MGEVREMRKRQGRGIRRFVLAAVLAACAAAAGVTLAQAPVSKTLLMEPPAPLLPAKLGNLERAAEGDSGDGLGAVDAADKPVLSEDGLKRFARSDYAQGAEHGNVTVYQFVDASGAIAAFDYFRRPGPLGAAKMGDETAPGAGGEIVFRSGKNVVRENFNLHGEHVGVLMGELIDHLPKALGSSALLPLVPTLLPAKGLQADSVRYALGPESYRAMGGGLPADAMGFDKSAEAVTAKYKNGGLLTLLLYPTPEIAGDHARAIESQIKQQGAAAGTVVLRREGPLVAVTTGAWPATDAKAMVEGIHLRSEVSFDKPMPVEFHTEMHKTYTLLESVAVFSALGALAALVLGTFFGFGRAAIRVMMGKPAATEPEFLRIDLRGLGTKSVRGPKA
jgi:hypothetical protein